MKTILMTALAVMVFTGAMAQQKTKEISTQAKSNQEIKLDKQGAESSQSAHTKASLNAQELKSTAKEQRNAAEQKLATTKETINEKATRGAVISTVASVNGQVNSVVKNVNVTTGANLKTDVKVKTDVNVIPASINIKVKAATGIKL